MADRKTSPREFVDEIVDSQLTAAADRRLGSHAAFAIPLAFVALAIARTIGVARGNVSTALVLLESSSPVEILLRSFIGLLAALPTFLFVAASQARDYSAHLSSLERSRVAAAPLLLLAAFTFLVDYTSWIAGFVLFLLWAVIILTIVPRFVRRKTMGVAPDNSNETLPGPEPSDVLLFRLWSEFAETKCSKTEAESLGDLERASQLKAQLGIIRADFLARRSDIAARRRVGYDSAVMAFLVFMSLGLVFAAAQDFPWMAAERLRIDKGTELTVFVVGIDDGWATLLREDSRSILRIRDDKIIDRQVCEMELSRRNRTMFQLLTRSKMPSNYPKC